MAFVNLFQVTKLSKQKMCNCYKDVSSSELKNISQRAIVVKQLCFASQKTNADVYIMSDSIKIQKCLWKTVLQPLEN